MRPGFHGADAVRGFGIGFARDPAESTSRLAFGQQFPRIGFDNASDQRYGSRQIGDVGGHGEHGIHGNGHRQLTTGTVINDSSLGCDFRGALLLALSSLFEVAIAEDLQIDEAQADSAGPKH